MHHSQIRSSRHRPKKAVSGYILIRRHRQRNLAIKNAEAAPSRAHEACETSSTRGGVPRRRRLQCQCLLHTSQNLWNDYSVMIRYLGKHGLPNGANAMLSQQQDDFYRNQVRVKRSSIIISLHCCCHTCDGTLRFAPCLYRAANDGRRAEAFGVCVVKTSAGVIEDGRLKYLQPYCLMRLYRHAIGPILSFRKRGACVT